MENQRKQKSNGRKKYDIQPDQLCWNCKRCTNPDNLPCPWAADGTPIDGWTATPGRKIHHYNANGERTFVSQSYAIEACPLFVKDREIASYPEALEHIAKALGRSIRTIQGKPRNYVAKYEATIGPLPAWVKEHAEEIAANRKNPKKIIKNRAKTLDKNKPL